MFLGSRGPLPVPFSSYSQLKCYLKLNFKAFCILSDGQQLSLTNGIYWHNQTLKSIIEVGGYRFRKPVLNVWEGATLGALCAHSRGYFISYFIHAVNIYGILLQPHEGEIERRFTCSVVVFLLKKFVQQCVGIVDAYHTTLAHP